MHLLPSLKGIITKTTTYNRYSYLNLRLIQSTNLKAIIQPSKSFLKFFKTPDNIDLESLEFEKIYSVEADDQINIRKLLKPKLQENLVELAFNNWYVPKISIFNETISFAFNSFSVLDWDDSERKVGNTFDCVFPNMVQSICEKIKEDIDFVFYALTWVERFNFFKD